MKKDNEKILAHQLSIIDDIYNKLFEERKKLLKLKRENVDKDKINLLLEVFFVDVSIINYCFICLKLQLQAGISKDYYKNELKKNIFELTKNLLEVFKKDRNTTVINSDLSEEDKENMLFFLENENFKEVIKTFRNLSIVFDRVILLFKKEEQKWYNYFLEAQNNILSIFKGMLEFSQLVMLSYPSNSKKYFEYETGISIFYEFLNGVILNQREAFILRDSNVNLQEALHLLMLKQNFEKLILNDQDAYLETVKKYRKWASLIK